LSACADATSRPNGFSMATRAPAAQRPLHYMAIPSSLFAAVIDHLTRARCAAGARVAIEKPFGRDVASAQALNRTLRAAFPESSIFRIDHFLGKEPILNLLYFRFANRVLEKVFDRDNVDSIQITMAESFGVQGRGSFYEETGAIRDVLQNHLLQLLAILTMDPPAGHHVESIRDEKARLLRSVAPLTPEDVVRGQFRGYRDEPGVARDSLVETFVACRLRIESWRWAGVPIFIRAGKSLAATAIEVRVSFKAPPLDLFGESSAPLPYHRFHVGPDVAVLALSMRVKRPGEKMEGTEVELVAAESQARDIRPYERLLGDALHGDAMLFGRQDAIEEQWRIVEGVLDARQAPFVYEPGSWGPKEAERLVAGVSGGWRKPIAPKEA
jgi:glucose-6-phosphate 1-dehydrogenase